MECKPEPADEIGPEYNFGRRIPAEKTIYRECDLLIATTLQQGQILSGAEYAVRREKMEIIPPGYDPSRFHPVSKATRHALKQILGLEGKVVLALGRLAHNKGYDLLLRAMPYLLQRVPDARLLLAIGSAQFSEDEQRQLLGLQQLARTLGIADRVLFRDYIPDAALADYYRAADVFALSSRYEPFGMTAIEAMACGTPTVLTTAGGLWEQLTWGMESVYANPCDPEAFGHALCQVLLYPRIADVLAQLGPRKARECFPWAVIGRRLLESLYGKEQHSADSSPCGPATLYSSSPGDASTTAAG